MSLVDKHGEVSETGGESREPGSGPRAASESRGPVYALGSPDARADIDAARAALRGKWLDPNEALALAKRLQSATRFSYARRLLLRASKQEDVNSDPALRRKICQALVLCTYKDRDQPAEQRLKRALGLLIQFEDPATTTDQETLGLLGAICKQRWDLDGQRKHLEAALGYYLRGYQQGVEKDQGYTSINAAFLLDQLASLEAASGDTSADPSSNIEERRALAREIRQAIVARVAPMIADSKHEWVNEKWWYYATVAEAHFGLGAYDEAVRWLKEGQLAARGSYEWEVESCARQLAALARLQDTRTKGSDAEQTDAYVALQQAFGAKAVPRTAFLGKVGLALSGGGFRASLYHLGVLAQLAELDVLRHVEVLSCVSGGSILGAHYYLEVRQLLQTKRPDEDITRQDYIEIVRKMIDDFVQGVQANVRTRVAVNPIENLRMLGSDYSRTQRAGELYERHLYSRVADGEGGSPRWLSDLTIAPLTRAEDGALAQDARFSPKYQNWRRTAKVPILVLNAATLNTGHTWQFTATWMGESPAAIDAEIDGNERLRRIYYADAPERHRRIRLGEAVGASAAVPGIFEPLTLDGLYPDRIVRLVDGGVCDNQGIVSLLEQDCKVVLVSDGSGQMDSVAAASSGILGVLLRTNSIFQARIREAEYHDLKARRRAGLLNGLMLVHLKGDLDVNPVDWVGCQEPYDASEESPTPERRGQLTRYGVSKEIQRLLSGLRTDLDSFSEAEAYALMLSGYRMTEFQFEKEKCVEGFSPPPKPEDWPFLQLESCMAGNGPAYQYLATLLRAGNSPAFKVWRIDPVLQWGLKGTLALLLAAFVGLVAIEWSAPELGLLSRWLRSGTEASASLLEGFGTSVRGLTLVSIGLALAWLVGISLLTRVLVSAFGESWGTQLARIVRWKDLLRRVALVILISTVGFCVALIHLAVFDRRFRKLGSLKTLLGKMARAR